jgi:hypothetical protein
MSRSLGLIVSLLLILLAPAIVLGGVFAARAESNLARQATGRARRLLSGPVDCAPPAGWIPVQAGPGETLAQLAARSRTAVEAVETANCVSEEIQPGDFVYLPATPAGSPTPCGPPPGWKLRQVGQDEGLPDLADELGVTEADLRMANCLGAFTNVLSGVRIYAPPTSTPPPTVTATATATASATPTREPTATPSATVEAP